MHIAEEEVQRLGGRLVEVAGRLVGEQDRGTHHQRARHGHALLLTPGELAGQVLRAVGHANLFESLLRARLALGRPHAAIS